MVLDHKEFRSKITSNIEDFIKSKKKAVNIEKGIFNFSIKKAKEKSVVRKWENKYFVQIYRDRFKTIYFNLNPKVSTSNKDLFNKIMSNKLKTKELTYMTHQDMNRKIWDKLIQEKIKKVNIEIHVDVNCDSNHMSSRYKNMLVGYVTGCGFDCKVKPESFVASSIADVHTRKK